MTGRLEGAVAFLTGAADGMGRAAAVLFASEGARVVATDVSADALERTVSDVDAAGGDAIGIVHDVTDPESWSASIQQATDRYGGLDVLVNNAGIHLAKGIVETTVDQWHRVMEVNVTGVWLGMRAAIPHLQARGGGSIVNVSSIAGMIGGLADGGGAAYSASKGAVRSLTKHAAQNLARHRIRVNSIHPGAVYTGLAVASGLSRADMTRAYGDEIPLPPHMGDPDDIAYGMLYLASNESKYVTGEELIIDGGWSTH